MFSIENLAVKVIKDIPNNLCYIDDAKELLYHYQKLVILMVE